MVLSGPEKLALYATMVSLMRENRTNTTFSTSNQFWPLVSAALLRDHAIRIAPKACRTFYNYREFRQRHPHSQDLRAHLIFIERMNRTEPMVGDAAGDSRRAQEDYNARHALDYAAVRNAAARGDASAASFSAPGPVSSDWGDDLASALPSSPDDDTAQTPAPATTSASSSAGEHVLDMRPKQN